MICPPCQVAGEFNRLAILSGPSGSSFRQNAEHMHEQCESKSTCPCQHFIGQAVQEEYR